MLKLTQVIKRIWSPPVPPADIPPAPVPTRIGETFTRPVDGAVMVAVPAGEFAMGDDDGSGDDAKPQHTVYLDAYWIDRNVVTVSQYQKFCDATRRKMPAPPEWGWKEDHPVVNASWHDAKAYCDWVGASLPTEAQWEKAARGIDGRAYPWGNDFDASRLWWSSNGKFASARETAPVGSFPAGASPYGCLDMAGNVRQWCSDWYGCDYYESAPANNPTGPSTGEDPVLRGSAWDEEEVLYFRCARRDCFDRSSSDDFIGFRCVVRGESSVPD